MKSLKELAYSLGLTKVGVTPAAVDMEFAGHLARWLEQGCHGDMDWMASRAAERSDLYNYFPEAKTVIAVALNYYTGDPPNRSVKISNYALGEDYHKILKKKLYHLLAFLRERYPEVKSRVCVDTSPVPDRVWVQRAGLGWIGKNTNLITRDYGSWLFLGELIVDVPMDYDEPETGDYCGSCTACLDACPTRALVAPHVLDSRRCISYLTIEHRGEIDPDLSAHFDGWVYGCDICQQVCPWNIKFQRETSEPAFSPRESILAFMKASKVPIAAEQFRETFRHNPVKRTGIERMERNLSIALKALE